MASTFTCLDYHVVFSTKYRRRTIVARIQTELYQYLGGIVRGEKGCLHEIGGMSDHVHLLVGLPPTVALSDAIRIVKANSSKWVNERSDQKTTFQWQTGYAAFAVSLSRREAVRRYIQQQESHHHERSFEEEFLELLKRHQIEFDPRYVFEQEHVG